MKFQPTSVAGCYVIEPEPRGDARGFFARIFDADAFRERGLAETFVQFNNALSREPFTLRGLHFQAAPNGEDKLVRCTTGAVFDVVLDLRKGSSTFGRWTGAELNAENRRLLYAPKGCAHGYLTLVADSELIYFSSAPYAPVAERVVRWNDPTFAVQWPHEPAVMSDKDRNAPDFDLRAHVSGY